MVDNASCDDTPQTVRQQKDSRVHYVRNPVNLGFARNLQKALDCAGGDLVVFLSADDYFRKDYLEKTLSVFSRQPGIAFVHTGHDLVSESGAFLERRIYPWEDLTPEKVFLRRLAEWNLSGICLSSALIRHSALKAIGGVDSALDHAADYGLWMRLCLLGPVGYVPEPLVCYRVHPGQSTRTFKPGLRFRLVDQFLRIARENTVDLGGRAPALRNEARRTYIKEILKSWIRRLS